TPDASALLDLTSINKGLLAPRMTTAQRIAISSPAAGLLVYDISLSEFYYFNGTIWTPIGTTGWGLTGNSGTISATNFVGTSDNADLVFRTNNIEKARITSGGNVGIGTTNPFAQFTVATDQISGNRGLWSAQYNSSPNGVIVGMRKSGGTETAPLKVNSGDYGGVLLSQHYDGNNYLANGNIGYRITGATSSGNIPGEWFFAASNSDDNDSYNTGSVRMVVQSSGKVGIGTVTPAAKFQVTDGSVLFDGTTGTTPVNGSGTRMMWVPAKGAFRAGTVDGTKWDDAFIGQNSFAGGNGNAATASYSTAFGENNWATGEGSIAAGINSSAQGFASMALGYYSFTGPRSAAFGDRTTASGEGSFASGCYTYARGFHSTAMGDSTRASGVYSFASGGHTVASGNTSTAFGWGTVGRGAGCFALGIYNDSLTSADPINCLSTNPLFIIGNGDADNVRSNAVVVLKNGNTGLGTNSPAQKLEVNGSIRQNTFSQNVIVPGGGSFNFTWNHNLGYNPIIILVKDQTGGGYLDYVEMSYANTSGNDITIYLTNNSGSDATGTIRWILVY
ncbi:MAG: hypothetical protein ABI855_15510, partial [Bacteroidota bacterium]